MKRNRAWLAALFSSVLVWTLTTHVAAAAPRRDTILIAAKKAPYYCNEPITEKATNITRGIIVIHGGWRNVDEYFESILQTMPSSPDPARDWRRKTIVLAPLFQSEVEAEVDEYWWKGDWREGGASGGMSSFEVVDTLVARLRSGTFPNLKWIVVTGHSAGGQFVQRYAAFTDIDLKPAPNSAFVKFVPANPSSYVYLNNYRPGSNDTWILPPQDRPNSQGYNQWKYGLEGLSGYAAARGAAFARTHLPGRQIELLAGTADVVADGGFDLDPAAMWQGSTRFERARNFSAFMARYFPTNHFRLTPVPGVGHDQHQIYASEPGKNALYFPD